MERNSAKTVSKCDASAVDHVEIVDIGGVSSALWKIRRTPFLGKLLAASGLGFRASLVCHIVLAISLYFLSVSTVGLAYKAGLDGGGLMILGVTLQLVCYGIILLLAISIWGIIQLDITLGRTPMGTFGNWIQAFFGAKSRIPFRFPESTSMHAQAVGSLILALLLWTGGSILLICGIILVSIPMVILAAGVLTFARKSSRRFRRLTAIPSSRVLQEDLRDPVLFLRSFNDDGLAFKPGFLTLGFGKTDRFEEKLAMNAWREGPVVAIGKPGEKLPEWGACREYHTDDTWQDRVLDLMNRAGGICMLVGLTEALGWEIHQLRETGAISKSVFVVPPLSGPEVAKRLERFSSLVEGLPENIFSQDFSQRLLCLIFVGGESPVAFCSSRRNPDAYGVAMHAAFFRLAVSRNQFATLPEPESRILHPTGELRRHAARLALLALPAWVLGTVPFIAREANEEPVAGADMAVIGGKDALSGFEERLSEDRKTWTGKIRPYVISSPADWTLVQKHDSQHDMLLASPHGIAAFAVMVEESPDPDLAIRTSEKLAEVAEIMLLAGGATDIKIEALEPIVSTAGQRWLRSLGTAKVGDLPASYLYSSCQTEDASYLTVAIAPVFRAKEFQPEFIRMLNDIKLPE